MNIISTQPTEALKKEVQDEIELSRIEHDINAALRRMERLRGMEYVKKFLNNLPLVF